jgi:pimeloyl-ACP methyl ester carboxylesterase
MRQPAVSTSLTHQHSISGYVSQIPIHAEIAASLSKLLRQGQYTGTVGAAKSIVLVSHSLGSYVSNDVSKGYPTLADAAVLTGSAYATALSDQGTFIAALGLRISAQHDPTRYAALDTGYFRFVDLAAHITTFFKAPAYELEAALYAHSIAAPIAIAEFLSAGPVNSSIAPTYTGPVLVTTGEFDFGLCDGDCYPTYAAQKLETIFPASKYIDAFIHPGAAHGVNFAKNATGFYERITAFLGRAGF